MHVNSDGIDGAFPDLKVVCSQHQVHCGSLCTFNVWLKDGKVDRISSAGDIPYGESFEADESIADLMQRRGCMKGYAEKRKANSPDRLKYPLFQTGERGDVRSFRRIGWDEALDTVAAWYAEMLERKRELGYLPVWEINGVGRYLGTTLRSFGNYSTGNGDAALYYALGSLAGRGAVPVKRMFEAGYIVVWGRDPQASSAATPFYMTKAKEAGIPVTVVETRYTATAAAMSTGLDGVPPVIGTRPGTDAAMMAAMCNVIYRRNLHDEAFIKQYCFGFYPGDSVISQSRHIDALLGEPSFGKTFVTPAGCSFVEYLDELQSEHGGYGGVLKWAENLCGTPADAIERFAVAVATRKPVYWGAALNGGPQRQGNGMQYSWMLIALSAMTGNVNKPAGGFGLEIGGDGFTANVKGPPNFTPWQPYPAIPFCHTMSDELILYGSDGRTKEQIRSDTLAVAGVDIGADGRLACEMIVRGAGVTNFFNHSPNINKRVAAYKKLRHAVAYERQMTPTAAFSDIVLPVAMEYERDKFTLSSSGDFGVSKKFAEPMYEARTDREIHIALAKRLGIATFDETDAVSMRNAYKSATLPDAYVKIRPGAKLPETFDEFYEKGQILMSVGPGELPEHDDILSAPLPNETGRLNFFSPTLHKYVERATCGVAGARYVPLKNGYEDIRDGRIKSAKGLKYPLQLITPHVTNRANSYMDDVPMIQDRFPQSVVMSPEDALERGIADGDVVYVYSDYGCVKQAAAVSKKMAKGVVALNHGAYYHPSLTETYEARPGAAAEGAPDARGTPDGSYKMHITPVDLGGNPNVLIGDRNSGVINPYGHFLGVNGNGEACEVSKIKPE